MNKKTLTRTVIQLEILSEGDCPDGSLADIVHACTEGDCSMNWEITDVTRLSGKEAADAVIAQGSAPDSFGIDDQGNTI